MTLSDHAAGPTTHPNRYTASQVALAAGAALLAALVSTTVIATVAHAAGASGDFQPLTPAVYGTFTVIGVLAGLIGWLLVARTGKASATLRWLIPAVLVLSLVPDVLLGFSDRPGVSWGAVAALVAMHVVVTVAAVISFRRFLPID